MKNTFNSIVFAFCIFIILFIVGLFITGCDKEDVKPIDLHLFDGNWEVVFTDNQDVFAMNCILEITTESTGSEVSNLVKRGRIITYYINGVGTKFYDKEYSCIIRESGDGEFLVDLELQGELDNDDLWSGNYFYKIVKLNDTHMWWQAFSNGNKGTLKMRRRTDIL